MSGTRVATRWSWALLALIGLLWSSRVEAQRGIDVALFRPALDSYGILTVDRADIAPQWDFGFQLFTDYAANPLRLSLSPVDGTVPVRQAIMTRLVALHLAMQLGLTDWLELVGAVGMAAPAYSAAYGSYGSAADPSLARTGFYQGAPYTNVPPPDAAALDAQLGFKARLLRRHGLGLALAATATLPMGDSSAFVGDSSFTFRPLLIGDYTTGRFSLAVNLGAIVRRLTSVYDPTDVAMHVAAPRLLLDLGHELTWAVGASYRATRWLGVAVAANGWLPIVGQSHDSSADLLAGLQLFVAPTVELSVGAGTNVFTSASRREDYRAFLGVAWTPGGHHLAGDSDHDGIADEKDQCPNQPEDIDGFEDDDGCPDLDNDHDGIPDARDACPNEAEDRDGFEDDDGCPEPDNNQDGIPDAVDRCPNDPEDRDGFQDDDGCPDADNDGDGIPDFADHCPNEPETRNGIDDEDGCPDTGTGAARERVELNDTILFEAGKASLSKEALAAISRIADRLVANPQVRRVRIEGHAERSEPRATAIAQQRADAVRALLIERGVDAGRLQAVGYGSTRPVTAGASRAQSRRVELIVIDQ